MHPLIFLLLLTAAYLMGSIPNGLLVARVRGVDIRRVGSGNIGATNVFRSVGRGAGLLTFGLDAAKGFVPAFLFPMLATDALPGGGLWFGVAAILGHNFPVFLRFRGGKGVATSAGVILALAPWALLAGLLVWATVLLLSGYVSLASIAAAVAVPACAWWRPGIEQPLVASALSILALLVIARHHSNIRRLLAGTENRFSMSLARLFSIIRKENGRHGGRPSR